MSAGVLYVLFAVMAGNSDNLSITSLGNFSDQQQCDAARTTIEAALSSAGSHTPVFCAPNTAFNALEKATKNAGAE